MSQTVAPDVLTFELSQAWLDTWAERRRTGWETIIADGKPDGIRTVLFHPESGRYQELCLQASESATIPLPDDVGIGETIWAITMEVENSTWLHWTEDYRERSVIGKGIFTYPLGPARGDVSESLLYLLRVMGDDIVHLAIQHGFKRRHIRQLCVGRTISEALTLVERMTTTSTVAHALTYSLAVEDALGVRVSPAVASMRVLVAELERLTSHLGDLAQLAVSTGLPVPQMEYLACKEAVLQLNFDLFGHRYLRGVVIPGGAIALRDDPPTGESFLQARQVLSGWRLKMARVRQDLESTPSFLDRLHGAGVIPVETINFVRPVGPVGRSAGRALDARMGHPYLVYPKCHFTVPLMSSADAYGRFAVKTQELDQSFSLVDQLLDNPHELELDRGNLDAHGDRARAGFSWTEAPRGLMAYRVEISAEGTISHIGIATPSQRNWYVVASAIANHNILQDFPIIDASFNLSVAGWDG